MNLSEVLDQLEALADPKKIEFKKSKFGIQAHNALGVYQKDLKALASTIGQNDQLALELYATGIYEGRLLCSRLYSPSNISKSQMNKWAADFENWEICDSFCMGFFTKSPYAIDKALQWSTVKPEFVKRAAFTIMAAYGFADKRAGNEVFEQFLPIIEREAYDQRMYVRKAVNWALRSIGKRNQELKELAIQSARQIAKQESKSASWIAKDALRELEGVAVKVQDYPRHIYRV